MRPVLPEDLKVEYEHHRYIDGYLMSPETARNKKKGREVVVSAKGGKTVARVMDAEKKNVLAEGAADCSILDNYNKKIGRDIALGRALKSLA